MKLTRTATVVTFVAAATLSLSGLLSADEGQASGQTSGTTPGQTQGQASAVPVVAKLVAEPATLTLKTGEAVNLKVTALDAAGQPIPDAVVRVNVPRGVGAYSDGQFTAFRAGKFTVSAVATGGPKPITLEIPVTVAWPVLTTIEISSEPGRLYMGVTLAHRARGVHADGSERTGLAPEWRSSDPAVATVDRFGNVTALKAGNVTISATSEGVKADKAYTVVANPVTTLELGR